jgi:hypothetical protein
MPKPGDDIDVARHFAITQKARSAILIWSAPLVVTVHRNYTGRRAAGCD